MKKLFRKTMTVLGSVALLGATMSGALAASYPTPFSATNTAVVVGASAAASDTTAAVSIATNLGMKAASSSAATVVGGDSVDLGDVFGDIVLGASIGGTLYDDELPSVLKDGKVKTVSYSQSLTLGNQATKFGPLGNDEDNYVVNSDVAEELKPVLYLDHTTGALWTYTLTFDSDFDVTDAGNEKIMLAGKEYTIAPDLANGDDLILYASSNTIEVTYGQTQTVEVGGKSFTIAVTGGRDLAAAPEATVSINGVSSRVNAGDTIESNNEEFYVSEVFMNTFGDSNTMSVEIFVGAEKLIIDKDSTSGTPLEVELGDDTVDSVVGYFVNKDTNTDLDDLRAIVLAFTPSEADYDFDAEYHEYHYLEMGEAITDPVLGTFSVFFESASLDLTEDKELIEIAQSGDELRIKFKNVAGNEYTLAPLKNNALNVLDDFENLDRTSRKSKLILNKDGSSDDVTHVAEITTVEMDGSNVKSVTFAYAGTTEKVTVEDPIRRSADNLLVCYGVDNSTNPGTPIQVTGNFSIQVGSSCDYTNTGAAFYDGGLDSIYAANKVKIEVVSTDGIIKLTETHDDASAAEKIIFDVAWDGTDKEYTIDLNNTFNIMGSTYDDGDFGAYLTKFGSYIEHEADENTWVKVYTPEEQVTYNVFVATDVSSETPSETGKLTVLDSESSAYAGKNLIVVGGSAVNSVAASLLGLTGDARFGEGFTAKTSIVSGEALIEAFDHDGKVALLVAGYDAADTTKAASYLTSGATVSTDLGTKLRVTSQTEAVAITA